MCVCVCPGVCVSVIPSLRLVCDILRYAVKMYFLCGSALKQLFQRLLLCVLFSVVIKQGSVHR